MQTVALQHLLGVSLPGMTFGELWRTLGKIFLATAAMAVVVAGGWFLLDGHRGASLLAVLILIPAGVAGYAGALWLLKIEGREELVALAAKLRGKIRRPN